MSVRFTYEVQFDGDGDLSAVMAAIADGIAEQDGVSEVVGYGPMTKVIADPHYDRYSTVEGWVKA